MDQAVVHFLVECLPNIAVRFWSRRLHLPYLTWCLEGAFQCHRADEWKTQTIKGSLHFLSLDRRSLDVWMHLLEHLLVSSFCADWFLFLNKFASLLVHEQNPFNHSMHRHEKEIKGVCFTADAFFEISANQSSAAWHPQRCQVILFACLLTCLLACCFLFLLLGWCLICLWQAFGP